MTEIKTNVNHLTIVSPSTTVSTAVADMVGAVINNVAESSMNDINNDDDDGDGVIGQLELDHQSQLLQNYSFNSKKQTNEMESDDDDDDEMMVDDFEYPSDFDPNDYEPIEFSKEHKRKLLSLLNMIIPDLNPLNSFNLSTNHHKKSSKSKLSSSSSSSSLLNDSAQNVLARLTCLIQLFNDYFRPQEIWPLLGRLPLSLRMDKSSKRLKFIEELDSKKIRQLNNYFRCWLYLFYTCDEIIESIDIMEQSSSTPLEMFTMMILNVFNHLRDSLPQIRQIFIDHWFPLESFEKRLECFFRYDKIHQIIIHRLAHERLIHTLMNEKYLLVKKQLELKTKENDQLQLQLSRLQSTNSKNTLIQNNKSQINEMQTAIQPTTAPQTKIKPLSFSFSSMYNNNNNQSGKSLLPQQQSSSLQPKSQLKSILLAQPRSPVPSIITSDSCSNSAYSSSGSTSPTQSILNSTNSDISNRIKDSKPTSLDLAKAVANKIHQTRCTTKAKAESASAAAAAAALSNNNNKTNAPDPEYSIFGRRGRPRKFSSLNDSTDECKNQNKKARISAQTKVDHQQPNDQLMQSIRSRSRFKMKNSLLKIDSAETVNNKNSPKLPLSLNAISQQQTGPLKPIVKMNSTIGSKSLLDTTSSNNNSKNNNNDNSIKLYEKSSKSLIIKPLQVKTESPTMSSLTTFEEKFNIKIHGSNQPSSSSSSSSLPEINLALFYFVDSSTNRLICRICSENLNDMDKFLKHLDEHVTNNDVFQCEICAKIFTTKYKLTRHLPIHSGEKPFICQKCNRCYSRRDKLSEHIKAVHSEKPFVKNRIIPTVSSNEQDTKPQSLKTYGTTTNELD
ncbi:zinc-finger double domain containing protein [Dermatophagoides farinae]|uniref:Zinc-finger double domain containing protein n=1 Tax=Dermatophagoides farinae TaxID=6954 RepID=A0A9D4P223_DERFA|nr:zinc-finger double domain containing protein [Dermatophagoides farinae]